MKKEDLWLQKYTKLLETASWEIMNLGGVRPSTKYKLRHYLDEIPDKDSSDDDSEYSHEW